jgi:hypothetical protein
MAHHVVDISASSLTECNTQLRLKQKRNRSRTSWRRWCEQRSCEEMDKMAGEMDGTNAMEWMREEGGGGAAEWKP